MTLFTGAVRGPLKKTAAVCDPFFSSLTGLGCGVLRCGMSQRRQTTNETNRKNKKEKTGTGKETGKQLTGNQQQKNRKQQTDPGSLPKNA